MQAGVGLGRGLLHYIWNLHGSLFYLKIEVEWEMDLLSRSILKSDRKTYYIEVCKSSIFIPIANRGLSW